MSGRMKEGMRGIGKRIKCMGLGCSHGRMGESMRGSILRIRRRDRVFLFGLTIVDMKGDGLRGNSMEKGYI